MKKRLLSLLLALVMLVGMIPATSLTAFAAAADSVWVGGVEMTDGTYLANGATKTHTIKPSGGYAYYKDGTLTLNNYSYEGEGQVYGSDSGSYFYAIVYAENDLTVELVGTNTLAQTARLSEVICVSDADLTIDGNGKLIGTSPWRCLYADGDLTINGGTFALTSEYQSIMSGWGNVSINGGDIIAETTLIGDCIYANYDLTINGGNVTVISPNYTLVGGRSLTIAKDLYIRASTTADGELGEYVAAKLGSYRKIVITWPPINNVNVSATFSGTPADATTSTTGATVTATKWYRKNGSGWTELGASDTIKEGYTYRCEVTVAATDGYTLADGYTVNINGTAATKLSGNTWYRDVTITGYTSYLDVYDIALPEAGAKPDFTYNDVECRHSSVALVEWFECDKDGHILSGALTENYVFKKDTYYRVEVTVVPETNWQFHGSDLDFYINVKAAMPLYGYNKAYPNSVTGYVVYHVDDANGTYTIQIGDITLKDGDYLANNATSVTTVKPVGGYAYYKDGVLTLNNFVAAKLVRYYERYLEVELIGENKIGAIADYYYWDGNASNNYYTGLEFRGDGNLEFDGAYKPYSNISVNGDVFFNGSGDILLDAEICCFQYTDNVIINDGYVYCYTSQDSVFIGNTIIEVNGGKLKMLDGGSWNDFTCNGTLTIAAGSVYVSADSSKTELADCVLWDGVTDLNTYDCVWIAPKPEIWVGGVGMYDGDYLAVGATATQTTKPSGGYAYYKNGKLTLNNYSYEGKGYLYQSILGDDYAVIYSKKDLTLELIGNNTLNQTDSDSEMIYVDGANLTVGGDGKLTGTSAGYALRAEKDITINGGTVEVSAYSTSILSWGDVIINGGDIVAESVDRMGIYANDITINGGDVTAIGGNKAIQYDLSDGFSVAEGLTIRASTTENGALGEYVAANHDSYKKIVITEEVPLRDKITQMMMVDFRYWDENLEDSVSRTGFTVMNDQVRKIVEDNNFGAVILFSNNIQDTEQIFNLTKGFQEAATKNGGTPLMIASDQEGGSVYRLGTGTALPGNMALGATYATHGTKYAKEAGKIIGSELSALGINTNFAPVLDVNNNANNPVIGLRSYSDHAVMVGELAAAEIEGMAQYNLIGCAKHFPGHGDTATDSTYGLPLVNKALSVLEQNELKPYEVAIEKGVDMIMTAHILYPQLESDKILSSKTGKAESLPATMSDDILTDLLKVNMGFEGIIVTDAMNMAGITANWDALQSCVIAINAGVDMLCMPVSLYDMEDYAELVTIIDGIEAAVKKGDIPMSRINDAYNRIMKVKENRGILNYNADEYTLEKANAVVGCEANREMEREISAAAVTVIKNENNVLPLQLTGNSKVLMLVPYSNESGQMIMAWNRAKQAGFIPDGAEVDYFRFNSATISADLKAKLDWADTYIINSEISNTARMEGKHWLSAAPYAFCDYAEENGKIAIISSVDKPYDVQSYPKADAIVAAYGCKGSSVDPAEALKDGLTSSEAAYGPNIIAAVEVILGTYGAQGKLPLDIPVYDEESNCYLNEISYSRGYGLTYDAKKEMKIYVGGVAMFNGTYLANGATTTTTAKPSGGYAYYKDGTLTLNNYSYTGEGYSFGAVYVEGTDLTIELLGDNTLVQTQSGRDAICAENANLTIGGTGNLTCRGEDHGIWVGGGLTINGGTITAIGSTMAIRYSFSYGCTVAEGLTIQASTTADGALGEYVAENHDSYKKIVIAPAITLTGSATDGIKVKVEKLSGSATLIVAQYEGGKMVDVQMQTVSADNTYSFTGLTQKSGCTYKAFLVNSTSYAPLCAADEF